MKGERNGHALEPAELVNQIYFRLAASKKKKKKNGFGATATIFSLLLPELCVGT
jgi:hypothetical protein